MIRPMILFTLLLAAAHAHTDPDRVDHYQGLPAPTLAVALDNLHEYNAKLETLLDSETLTAVELNTVHQLTYTLEIALQRIADEVAAMAETLEEVHVASEQADATTARDQGRRYLHAARPLQR